MEYKLFDQPHSHDKAFYENREVADHINQPNHRPRLLNTIDEIRQILSSDDTVCDFGCGNGGLIRELQTIVPENVKIWGYDLQPSNVRDAHKKGTNVVQYKDFVNEEVSYPTLAICTEVIEHLVDPHAFIRKLAEKGVKKVVASSPAYETPDFHAPFHLWIWTEDSYKKMFEDAGWVVDRHYETPERFQFIVAHI